MFLYRIYQLIIMMPLMLVLTILTSLVAGIGCLIFGGWFAYYPAKIWSQLMCWLTLVKVEVHGRENISSEQSYVFVANHQGAYDIFAIYGFLNHNFRWMMKQSLQRIPLVGWACKRTGQVFVDNHSPAAIQRTMKAAETRLSGGLSLVVFPEGARTFTGEVGRFKRGAYTLATGFGIPVVPVTIDGAFKVMPRTSKIPRFGKIVLTIHAPIAASDPELIERSREAILSALQK